MENGPGMDGNIEGRPRSAALDIALSVDLEVEKEHDHWRNPEVKPQVGAHQSSVVAGVDVQRQPGLPMSTTGRWATSYRRKRKSSMRN